MKLKVDGHLTLACSRPGCASVLLATYKKLGEEIDYRSNNLDEAIARVAMETGWRPNADDTALVCPHHLDTGGKRATFGYDGVLGRNVVTLVLDEEESRMFCNCTFRVLVDTEGT